MEREQYAIMARQEERHWWYTGMRRVALAVLDGVLDGRCRLRHRGNDARPGAFWRGVRGGSRLGGTWARARTRADPAGAGQRRRLAVRVREFRRGDEL